MTKAKVMAKIEGRMTTSQPKDWIEAWRNAASEEGVTLAEWVGACCNANLTAEVVEALSERRPAHRPPGSRDTVQRKIKRKGKS